MNGENMEALYREAKSRYDHRANEDDVAAAEAMFRELGDYADAPAYVEKCETLKRFAVGRTVEFGAGLRWRVVDLRGRMRLLLPRFLPNRRVGQEGGERRGGPRARLG